MKDCDRKLPILQISTRENLKIDDSRKPIESQASGSESDISIGSAVYLSDNQEPSEFSLSPSKKNQAQKMPQFMNDKYSQKEIDQEKV